MDEQSKELETSLLSGQHFVLQKLEAERKLTKKGCFEPSAGGK